MKYHKNRTVDEKGIYHDRFELIIPYSELPEEFIEDCQIGYINYPMVVLGENELIFLEETLHG